MRLLAFSFSAIKNIVLPSRCIKIDMFRRMECCLGLHCWLLLPFGRVARVTSVKDSLGVSTTAAQMQPTYHMKNKSHYLRGSTGSQNDQVIPFLQPCCLVCSGLSKPHCCGSESFGSSKLWGYASKWKLPFSNANFF